MADFIYEARCATCGIDVEIFIDIPEACLGHMIPTLNVLCLACQKFMMKIGIEEIR